MHNIHFYGYGHGSVDLLGTKGCGCTIECICGLGSDCSLAFLLKMCTLALFWVCFFATASARSI